MFRRTNLALAAAIVLGAMLPASAATKHHRITGVRPQTHGAVSGHDSGDCSPVHPPLCSNICTGSGPCAPPDGW